jgi:hypothetical protein
MILYSEYTKLRADRINYFLQESVSRKLRRAKYVCIIAMWWTVPAVFELFKLIYQGFEVFRTKTRRYVH